MCLGQGVDLHMAQLMALPLTISCSSKSRMVLPFMVLPFWCQLTWIIPDKIQEGHKMVVCVCVWVLGSNCHHSLRFQSLLSWSLHVSTRCSTFAGILWEVQQHELIHHWCGSLRQWPVDHHRQGMPDLLLQCKPRTELITLYNKNVSGYSSTSCSGKK